MAKAGEVWMIDLGMVAKVRPCLLLTDYPADDELALVTVLPHTTALRGNRWELSIPKPFPQAGCVSPSAGAVGFGRAARTPPRCAHRRGVAHGSGPHRRLSPIVALKNKAPGRAKDRAAAG